MEVGAAIEYMSKDDQISYESWFEKLFIRFAHLYLPVLEYMKEDAKAEVDGLCKMLDQLAIQKGSKLLDFSCGIGRHAVNLAKVGYRIVGYDPSPLFIERAKFYANKELSLQHQEIRFYTGGINDFEAILSTNNETNFDGIIIMFSSIGYLSEDEDYRILKQLLNLAHSGCVLIIQTENRDQRIFNTPNHHVLELEKALINELWRFDQYNSIARSKSKYYYKDLQDNSLKLQLELEITLRLYSLHELKRLMNSAGWEFVKCYGDVKNLDEVSLNSQNLITIGRKP